MIKGGLPQHSKVQSNHHLLSHFQTPKLPTPKTMKKRTPQPITITTTFSDPHRGAPSPLERNPRSPGWINRDSDGVGLGLVAALERFPSTSPKLVLNLPRVASPPIPIASPSAPRACFCGCDDDERKESGLFSASPVEFPGEVAGLFTAGFLSSCYLCRKKLDGKDIYMYGGEKAFCSMECRYRQIVADEYQESCGSVASRPSVEIASSGYSGPRLFYTGIMAA